MMLSLLRVRIPNVKMFPSLTFRQVMFDISGDDLTLNTRLTCSQDVSTNDDFKECEDVNTISKYMTGAGVVWDLLTV